MTPFQQKLIPTPLFLRQVATLKQKSSQNLDGGEQGEVILFLLLLLMALGLFMTLSFKKLTLMNIENKQRKSTYLCLKSTMDSFTAHLGFIKKTNLSIVALNAAIAANPTPYLIKLRRIIQTIQDKKSAWVFINQLRKQVCRGLQKVFVKKSFPLKGTGFKPQRSLFGTVLIKQKPASFLLPSRKSPPFLFLIKGKLTFRPELIVHDTKEIPLSLHTLR